MGCGFSNFDGYGGYGGHGMMTFGGVFILLLIVIAIVLFLNSYSRKNANVNNNVEQPARQDKLPATNNSAALALLDERYVKGEIEQQDYLRIKQDLQR